MFKYEENIIKCANDALQKPDDFGYWGPEDTFVTWGFCGIDKHRDSDILQTSNFEVITNDLMKRFPEDFRIEGYGHWAVGHIDRLVCRVLKSPGEVTKDNITDAFIAAMKWNDELMDYPIADEGHYSDMETLAIFDWVNDLPSYQPFIDMFDEDMVDWQDKLLVSLYDDLNETICPDTQSYPKDNEILMAAYISGIWNPEKIELWEEFCSENNLEYPPKRNNPNQLNLFESDDENGR